MDDSNPSSSKARTGRYSLLHPGRTIWLSRTCASGCSKVERWSEEELFLSLMQAWRDTFLTLPGSDSSRVMAARENISRLLGEWLSVCSLDSRRPH